MLKQLKTALEQMKYIPHQNSWILRVWIYPSPAAAAAGDANRGSQEWFVQLEQEV